MSKSKNSKFIAIAIAVVIAAFIALKYLSGVTESFETSTTIPALSPTLANMLNTTTADGIKPHEPQEEPSVLSPATHPKCPKCPVCPPMPDMTKYIRIDEIPCWNCNLTPTIH